MAYTITDSWTAYLPGEFDNYTIEDSIRVHLLDGRKWRATIEPYEGLSGRKTTIELLREVDDDFEDDDLEDLLAEINRRYATQIDALREAHHEKLSALREAYQAEVEELEKIKDDDLDGMGLTD